MNTKAIIMKELIDLGIVESKSNETITCSYKTPDGNYIINLTRKPRLSFLSEKSQSSYLCSIDFYSSLSSPILKIDTTELEIMKMIDSFYNLIELNIGTSVYHYFNPITSVGVPKVIGLFISEDNLNSIGYNQYNISYNQIVDIKYSFAIYDKVNEQLLLRLNIPMNESSIVELLEKMYYTFLIDLNIEENYQ